MMTFEVDPNEALADAMVILQKLDPMETVHFRGSPRMFSIIVRVPFPPYIVALKMMPPFFKQYTCNNQIHYFNFPNEEFFHTVDQTRRDGFSLFYLTLTEHNPNIAFVYQNRLPIHQHAPIILGLPTSTPDRRVNIGQIDYGSFVSFDLYTLKRLATALNNVALAPVTITNSQIKFLVGGREVILTTERRECIIGGVAEGEVIQYGITLFPMEFYLSLTSERLWLFKSYGSLGLILIAPIGLYAHISAYYPHNL